MPEITVTVLSAGEPAPTPSAAGTKAWELFADDPSVIAANIGGEGRGPSAHVDDG